MISEVHISQYLCNKVFFQRFGHVPTRTMRHAACIIKNLTLLEDTVPFNA